ncbi:MAG: hypothetical protein HKO92_09230 [Flavobacteriaceae bacterium]|nr:hypothetical protein [Flavobacteriaceae bacterium]
MKKVWLTLSVLFVMFSNVFAQTSVNNYKYVVVPERFEFLKKNDQFQLNSLTKFLLEKEGLMVFMSNDNIPKDLAENRCLVLNAKVIDHSKLFKTKLKLELLDCYNNVVIESKIGESREKEFRKAYHEALRNAYESIKGMNYAYTPKDRVPKVEIESIKEDKKGMVAVVSPNIKEPTKEPVKVKEPNELKKPAKKAVPVAVVKSPEKNPEVKKEIVVEKKSQDILYAQPIDNGYQLVDMSPKVVMILINTSLKDVYVVKGQDAIVYKKDGKWYHSKGTNSLEALNIKF